MGQGDEKALGESEQIDLFTGAELRALEFDDCHGRIERLALGKWGD
jgi:hypothetical protein